MEIVCLYLIGAGVVVVEVVVGVASVDVVIAVAFFKVFWAVVKDGARQQITKIVMSRP